MIYLRSIEGDEVTAHNGVAQDSAILWIVPTMELKALGLVVQTGGDAKGKGVKGSPLRYFRPNDSFLPIKGGVPKE